MFGLKRKPIRADESFFTYAAMASRHSPDANLLQQHRSHLVFICDELMLNYSDHYLIRDNAQWKAAAYTEPKFALWHKPPQEQGEEPITIPLYAKASDRFAPMLPILGEVWSIETNTLLRLDKFKLNGVQFRRELVTVSVPWRDMEKHKVYERSTMLGNEPWRIYSDPRKKTLAQLHELQYTQVQAFMYIGVSEFWEDMLDAGYTTRPAPRFTSKSSNQPYYYLIKEGVNI